VNALNGYFQMRQELFHWDEFRLLSLAARGALLELMGRADASRFESKIFGAVCGERDLWNAQDAILELAVAEMEAMAPDCANDDDAQARAGMWLYELRDAGFVRFENEHCILIVQLYVEFSGRAVRSRPVPGERRGGNSGVSGSRPAHDMGEGVGGHPAGRGEGSHAPAYARTFAPARPPPFPSGGMGGGADGRRAWSPSHGGKGAVSAEMTDYGSNQTRPNQTSNFQTPNQTVREDAMGPPEGKGGGDFHALVWEQPIVQAAQWACRQSDKIFTDAFIKRSNHYGENVCRLAIEHVARAFEDEPHTIKFVDAAGRKVGGPILWRKMEDFAAGAGIAKYEKPRKMGFR
jgi:hypothetical protein